MAGQGMVLSRQSLAPMPVSAIRRMKLPKTVYGSRSMEPNDALPAASSAEDLLREAIGNIRTPVRDKTADWSQYDTLMRQAGGGPTDEEIKAAVLRAKMGGLGELDQQLSALPVPQQDLLQQPDLPQLNLPAVPQRQNPQFDPAAGIGAAILGLIAPQHAGQFGAAALRGSLEANQQQYEDDQRRYQEQFRESTARHEDQLNAENVRRRIEMENKDRQYQNTVVQVKQKMEAAQRAADRAELGGEASVLDSFGPKVRAANEAKTGAAAIKERLGREYKADDDNQDRAVRLAQVAGQMDNAAENRASREENQRLNREARANAPRQIMPGGQLLDPNTGQIIYTNPARPVPYNDGQGLRDPYTGKPIVPATPKPPKTGAGGAGTVNNPDIQRAKSLFTSKKSEYEAAVRRWNAYSAQIDKGDLDGQDPGIHATWDAMRKQVEKVANEYQAADREYRNAINRPTVSKGGGSTGKLPPGITGLRPGK